MSTARDLTTHFDLIDAAVGGDPYPYYRQLRACDPVHYEERWGGWLLTRHDDIAAALQDSRFSLGGGAMAMFDRLPPDEQRELTQLRDHLAKWLGSFGNKEDHDRIASLMQRAFTQHRLEALRQSILTTVDELIDLSEHLTQVDLLEAIAHPLPVFVITRLLGVPSADRDRFVQWSTDIINMVSHGYPELEVMFRAQQTVAEMSGYIRGLLDEIRSNGETDTLLGTLRQAMDDGYDITEDEIIANCALLFFSGHATTTILIGNSVLALLTHHDQRLKLLHDPSLISGAVMEFLRYDSPVQMIRRRATEDMTIGGKAVLKGDMAWLVLGSANRDPKHFVSPDRLDITRRKNRHLAMGGGLHSCLGAALGKFEVEIAVARIFERLPDLTLDTSTIEWWQNPVTRALKSLPVRLRA